MVDIGTHFEEVREVLATLRRDELVKLLHFVRGTEGVLWICGNGGSGANAIHWECDLTKAAAQPARALGVNQAVLTAWSNDEAYSSALSAEFGRMARAGDRLVCLSCSGTSENILTVLRHAWKLKIPRALLTGKDWLGVTPIDVIVRVPSRDYGVIEDVHLSIGHWLTKALQEGE